MVKRPSFKSSPLLRPALFACVALCVVPVVALVVGLSVSSAIEDFRTKSWPTVPGVVLESRVHDPFRLRETTDDPLLVTYEYVVDWQVYRSTRVVIGLESRFFSLSSESERLARTEYAAGKTVMVHYDPENPASAVLRPGIGTRNIVHSFLNVLIGYSLVALWPTIWRFLRRVLERTEEGII